MSEQQKMDQERADLIEGLRLHAMALSHTNRNATAAIVERAAEALEAASLPVGVPDGWALTLPDGRVTLDKDYPSWIDGDMGGDGYTAVPLYAAPAAQPAAIFGKYGNVLRPFMAMMEAELHANAGKGDRPGWLSMSAEQCMLEIYYHAAKLQKAIKKNDMPGVREYTADVANMAMMLADICGWLDTVNAELDSPAVEDGRVGMADAYIGAREDLAIWKRRALEAEQKVRHQEQIIDHLTLEAQGETRFGEPSLPAAEQSAPGEVEDPQLSILNAGWAALSAQGIDPETVEMLPIYRAMLAARDAGEVRVPVELVETAVWLLEADAPDSKTASGLRAILAQRERGDA